MFERIQTIQAHSETGIVVGIHAGDGTQALNRDFTITLSAGGSDGLSVTGFIGCIESSRPGCTTGRIPC